MQSENRRDLVALPKAHLHLHFTGSMRIGTLADLAAQHGIPLPEALTEAWPPRLHATDERGWFRFQRLYDLARSCVRGEADLRRLVHEAAEDDAAEGSRWLEIQVEPTSYAPFVGGLTPALEIILDEARAATREVGIGVAVVVAASRVRHPLDARTLARLAVRYAGSQPGDVVGFGLSNDERRGALLDFVPAFEIARRGGLALVPHAGELLGPASVQDTLTVLRPDRIGHGVRCVEDPRVMDEVADAEVTLEVCPGSNVSLGSIRRRRTSRCALSWRPGSPWHSARTTPSSSARGCSRSMRWPARISGSTTSTSPPSLQPACAAAGHPATSSRRRSTTSTGG